MLNRQQWCKLRYNLSERWTQVDSSATSIGALFRTGPHLVPSGKRLLRQLESIYILSLPVNNTYGGPPCFLYITRWYSAGCRLMCEIWSIGGPRLNSFSELTSFPPTLTWVRLKSLESIQNHALSLRFREQFKYTMVWRKKMDSLAVTKITRPREFCSFKSNKTNITIRLNYVP